MSLGWLTESSLIPKEPKPIKGVGTASLLQLQAAVYERERRGSAAAQAAKRRRGALDLKGSQNQGVEARAAKDKEWADMARGEGAAAAAAMRSKVERYEAMVAGQASGGGEALVDFSRKRDLEIGEASAACSAGEGGSSSSSSAALAAAIAAELTAEALRQQEEAANDEARLQRSAVVAPPDCLGGGVVVTSAAPAAAAAVAGPGVAPPPPAAVDVQHPESTAPQPLHPSAAAVRQNFERRPQSAQEVKERIFFSELTDHQRGTVGQERRLVRDSVRERLAALRAAKAASSDAETVSGC